MSAESNPTSAALVVTVIHGRQRHSLTLPSTLGELTKLIETATSIPQEEQMLIIAGRKLQGDANTPLSSVGVASGMKVLVMHNRQSNKPKEQFVEVHSQMKQLRGQEELLPDILSALATARKTVDELVWVDATEMEKSQVRTYLSRIEEKCMRTLEVLDSISGPSGKWKDERKRMVREVQKALDSCDALGKELKRKSMGM